MTNKKHYFIVGIILLFLSIPVLGTILYSFSSSWGATVLPDGLSLKWYNQLFLIQDSYFRYKEAYF